MVSLCMDSMAAAVVAACPSDSFSPALADRRTTAETRARGPVDLAAPMAARSRTVPLGCR